MQELINEITVNTVAAVSSVDANSVVHTRFMEIQKIENAEIIFGTNPTKEIYKHLQNNPTIALAITEEKKYIRIEGEAEFVDCAEELLKQNKGLAKMFEGKEKDLKTFKVKVKKIAVLDFSNGKPELKEFEA